MSEDKPEPTFEEALEQLERIVDALGRGELDLAASLASYETGVGLLSRCQAMLDGVDRSVALLTGVGDDGTPITEPFDASATPSEKPASRSTRSRRAPSMPGDDGLDLPY